MNSHACFVACHKSLNGGVTSRSFARTNGSHTFLIGPEPTTGVSKDKQSVMDDKRFIFTKQEVRLIGL